MRFALIILGTVLGYVIEPVIGAHWWPMLLGAFAGYAVTEIRALYSRTRELDVEIRGLKERLADVARRLGQVEGVAGTPGEDVAARDGGARRAEAREGLPGGRRESGCAPLALLAVLRNPWSLWRGSLPRKPSGRPSRASTRRLDGSNPILQALRDVAL